MIGIFLVVACPVRAMERHEERNPLAHFFDPDREEIPCDNEEPSPMNLTELLMSYMRHRKVFNGVDVYNFDDNELKSMGKLRHLTADEQENIMKMMQQENYVYLDEQGQTQVHALVVGTNDECKTKQLLGIKEVDQETTVMNPLYQKLYYSDDTPVLEGKGGELCYKGTVGSLKGQTGQFFIYRYGYVIVGQQDDFSFQKKLEKYLKKVALYKKH